MILLSDDKDYFYILYLVYVGMNMLLAGIALLHWPGAEQLELVNDPEGYQVCCAHAICVKWMCTSYTGHTKHSLYVGSVTASLRCFAATYSRQLCHDKLLADWYQTST